MSVLRQGDPKVASNDLSFEIWLEIFRAIVVHEKKALVTGEAVCVTVDITQRVSDIQFPIACIEVVCEPNAPAQFRRV
jgi:hypothetical protein